jgi:hypothetical protein
MPCILSCTDTTVIVKCYVRLILTALDCNCCIHYDKQQGQKESNLAIYTIPTIYSSINLFINQT